MKPRILIFSVAYDPYFAGAELAVKNITDRLPGYDFDLITCRFTRHQLSVEQIGNTTVYRVGFGNRLGRYLYPVLALQKAARLHKANPYRVVWAIMASYAGAAALMFLRRYPRVKFLLSLQEGDSIEHIHKRVRGFRRFWRKIFKRVDYIQVISSFLEAWAKKEGAKCPVVVIPNGVDISKIKNKKLKIKITDTKIIITTSRLVPKNGIDILIRAAKQLQSSIFGSRFVIRILGAGFEEKKLKQLAKDLGVEKEVEFLGNIKPNEVPQYLAEADVFVRPSRSEGLGSSFLEAMAAGLPIIGTPVGGIVDFLKDYETGLFCQPEDPKDLAKKILILLGDDSLKVRLVENGERLILANYSWDKIGAEMKKVFETLL